MATVKRTTKKAATKKTAKLEKIGHFNITLYKNDSAAIELDCPSNDLIATLASIIASDELPGQLIRAALSLAAFGIKEEKAAKKKAAPKKKK